MTLEVIERGKERLVELTCSCGCGKKYLVKLKRFYPLKCYGKSLEKKNKEGADEKQSEI